MTKELFIKKTDRIISVNDLNSLQCLSLNTLWNGNKATSQIKILLAHNSTHFFFGGICLHKPYGLTEHPPGSYLERLWEKDVIELFLFSKDQNIYQEFQLAPNKLWWSHAFDDIRKRITKFQKPRIAIQYEEDLFSWRALLIIEKSSLSIPSNNFTHGNLTACIGKEEGSTPREFLSTAILPGEKPNFHQPQEFLPINTNEELESV